MPYEVVLLPGDGIGPEVITAAQSVVDATGVPVVWLVRDVGLASVAAGGASLPAEVVQLIRSVGIGLKGPVATPRDKTDFPSVNLALRRELGLHTQVRPCRSRPGIASPAGLVDIVVVRETTEDLYAGLEFDRDHPAVPALRALLAQHGKTLPPRAGVAVKFVTEEASRRVVEIAVSLARERHPSSITAVHKATVMPATDGLFLATARAVAATYPDVTFGEESIDSLCARMVRDASSYGVLVMGYQYGDIVSDLVGGLVGGIGMVPGVNLGPEVAVFEAAHGTAPRRAGQGIANPLAMVLSAAMLLRHIGEWEAADRVEFAVDAVLAASVVRTYDIAGALPPVSTTAMASAVIAALP